MSFKVGDDVRLKKPAKDGGLYVAGKVIVVKGRRSQIVRVKWADGKTVTYHELSLEKDDGLLLSDRIEDAIEEVKKDRGLCVGFDRVVDRARNMSFLSRLEAVAVKENRVDLYRHLIDSIHAATYAESEPEHVEVDGFWAKEVKCEHGSEDEYCVEMYYSYDDLKNGGDKYTFHVENTDIARAYAKFVMSKEEK